jgi:hypothetical protein
LRKDKLQRFERKSGRSKDRLEEKKLKQDQSQHKSKRDYSKTKGIEFTEIERRNVVGECPRCLWPVDRKGNHMEKDCMRPIKLDKGTACYPKGKK